MQKTCKPKPFRKAIQKQEVYLIEQLSYCGADT